MEHTVKEEAEEQQPITTSFAGRGLNSNDEDHNIHPKLNPSPSAAGSSERKRISSTENKRLGEGRFIQIESPAMIRAKEVQSSLEPAFPSFVKSLCRSYLLKSWMGLPGVFCKRHLPRENTYVTIEDERGYKTNISYRSDNTALSAGWRQFCYAYKLFDGDALVFQLIEPQKFKVYIIRAKDLHTKQSDAETGTTICTTTKRKCPDSLAVAVLEKKNKTSGLQSLDCNIGQPAEQSENDSEEVGSEVSEGFKLYEPTIQFKDVTSFQNFNILVDGLVMDSELFEDIRYKYYKLCSSQNSFLHENTIQGINSKLIVGTISETVNIADAIAGCKLTTSQDEYDSWDKALKAFELLGMNVGFLRTRLSQLVNLAFESEGAATTKRYIEAKTQRAMQEDEIRNLEAKLAELKDACRTFGVKIETLKSMAEAHELRFEEKVKAPW